jgi:hypothetical protein
MSSVRDSEGACRFLAFWPMVIRVLRLAGASNTMNEEFLRPLVAI